MDEDRINEYVLNGGDIFRVVSIDTIRDGGTKIVHTTKDHYRYLDYEKIKSQAKHLIEKCSHSSLCIHKINKYLIFRFSNYEVVNTEKYTINVFKTEKDAIDYCLDRYSGSKIPKQIKFNL